MKNWTFLGLLIILVLTTGASPGSASPTPTIVRLDRSALTPTSEVQRAEESSTETWPTSTSVSPGQPVARSDSNCTESRLVFATRSGGDLYVINIDGTGLRKLTSGVIDPVVSPDGRQVAFTRWDSGELGTLYAMNIDGSNERAILGEMLQAKSPTWSPDGQSIVVSFQQGGLRNPGEECRTFDADDGINLPDDIAEITHISFSDGELKICFIRREDLQWLLRQVDVDGGNFEDLPVDLYSFSPTWDPKQAWRVLYNTDKGLMQLDLNTGKLQPVTDDFGDKAPVFSPDGQKLALSYKQHDHWEVYTYDLASGVRQRLSKPPILADPQYNSAAPTWSPDGSKITFVTDRSGSWEIWVMNADGSEQRPLFSPEVQAQLGLDYQGMNERLLNWIGASATLPIETAAPSGASSGFGGTSGGDAASPANLSLSGDWDFSFGSMALAQQDSRVEGTYQWYGGADTGQIEGIVVPSLNQFRGMWVSGRSPTSQRLLRWQLAPDGHSFSGKTVGNRTGQQWCGVRSGQPLPAGCGFSGSWTVRFGNPPDTTGQATLTQTGPIVQGTYTDSTGQSGQIEGVITVQSSTEMKLTGTWRDDQGQSDTFEWRLDLTTGRTFQGRRDPGNSEWCGWRQGSDEPERCGWED